jgi:bifunctional pyridoxal-dependent enzyme with beta-cystathionase and maltose regulon repressor activities
LEIDSTVPGLGELHLRHSEKWAAHAPGVLCATIAEMDFGTSPELVTEAVARMKTAVS